MTASEAKTKLKGLKTAILADGKVDLTEVDILLEFIDEYIESDKFNRLKELLTLSKSDGVITEDESRDIIKEIDKAIRILTIEDISEKVVVYGVAVLIAVMFLLKFIW